MSGLQILRKIGEQVVVTLDNKEMILTVEDIRGSYVKLSFQGDKDIAIYRQEIAEKALHRA